MEFFLNVLRRWGGGARRVDLALPGCNKKLQHGLWNSHDMALWKKMALQRAMTWPTPAPRSARPSPLLVRQPVLRICPSETCRSRSGYRDLLGCVHVTMLVAGLYASFSSVAVHEIGPRRKARNPRMPRKARGLFQGPPTHQKKVMRDPFFHVPLAQYR